MIRFLFLAAAMVGAALIALQSFAAWHGTKRQKDSYLDQDPRGEPSLAPGE